MRRFKTIFLFFLVMLFTIDAIAHETDTVNLEGVGIIAYTSTTYNSIGIIYHFSTKVAIRPSFLLFQQDLAVKNYGLSLDLLYYLKQRKNLFLFVGAELSYYYDYRSYLYSDDSEYKYSSNTISTSFLIGGQYMFTEQFGFFADTGVSYSREREKLNTYDSEQNTTSKEKSWNNIFSIRSTYLGAIFYF